MTKSVFYSLFYFLGIGAVMGQSLPLVLIGSSGAQQEKEVMLQWSIGEPMVIYQGEENIMSVSEGFHQLFQVDRDLTAEAQVRAEIYPNPSLDVFKVQVDNTGIIEYVIVNAIGQILRTGSFERDIDIEMNRFSAGVYFMTLYTGARFDKTFSLIKI